MKVAAWLALSVVLPTVSGLPRNLETNDEAPDAAKVQVRYLGVAGLLIRRGADAILTAPMYSNPDPATLVGRLRPRTSNLDRFYREHRLEEAMPSLRAILVGHGHYDHLMDVQYFAAKAPQAYVLGSVTTKRILSGYGSPLSARLVALNEAGNNFVDFAHCAGQKLPDGCVVAPGDSGRPYDLPGTEGRIRVRAYCSQHPPQLFNVIHFWPGCQPAALTLPPARTNQYKEGEVLAFLIDFMEAGQPAFRIYYQDTAVGGPLAQLPASVIAERPVDLALLCAGNYDGVDHAERIVTALKAREVIVHHWENFFDPRHGTLAPIPGLDVDRYHDLISAELGGHPERVHVLKPGLLRNFPR